VRSVLLSLFVSLHAPVRRGLEVWREHSVLVSASHFQLLLGEVLRSLEVRSIEARPIEVCSTEVCFNEHRSREVCYIEIRSKPERCAATNSAAPAPVRPSATFAKLAPHIRRPQHAKG
jgi:hypothetical protein